MKYYAVVEIETTDRSWVAAYVQNVTRLVGTMVAGTWRAHQTSRESKANENCPRCW